MAQSATKIFVVEDDPVFSRLLRYAVELDPTHQLSMFKNGADLLDSLSQNPDVVTIDYSLPDTNGHKLLRRIKHYNPQIPVIVISGQKDVAIAVDLFKEGAYDYISKAEEDIKSRLLNSINNAKKKLSLSKEVEMLRDELSQKYDLQTSIVGQSEPIKEVFKLIKKASQSNITVSICGETGTGKELVAKAIHYNSERRRKPFIAINVSAIPEGLLESELFGHEKGAFTGASDRRIGKFEEASGGTLLIDEIGEMDMAIQTKLLRVLQERQVARLGSNKEIPFDVRILTATHRDLTDEVKQGKFREDLYYRLIGLPIKLPPLRNRGKDIIIIAKHFLQEFCQQNKMGDKTFSTQAKEKLMSYNWPGNIRELKAVVELSAVMADENSIEPNHLQIKSADTLLPKNDEKELTLREYNNAIIDTYLERYEGNVILVAMKLDVGKSTIYRYLKEKKEVQ